MVSRFQSDWKDLSFSQMDQLYRLLNSDRTVENIKKA